MNFEQYPCANIFDVFTNTVIHYVPEMCYPFKNDELTHISWLHDIYARANTPVKYTYEKSTKYGAGIPNVTY